MQVTRSILSWVRRVTSPIFGRDTRPLALRDTLPDQTRPTVPDCLVRPADMRAAVVGAQASNANNYAK